jgi:DNA-binding winged helix-turn-helix (wHTH) protein
MNPEILFMDYRWVDGSLSCRGLPIRLPLKEARVLGELVRNANRVVPIDQLLDTVWPGQDVTVQSLHRAVAGLRARLPELSERLVTHHRQGYCFEVDVQTIAPPHVPDQRPARPDAVGVALAMLGLQAEECCTAALHALHQIQLRDPGLAEAHAAVAEIEMVRAQAGHAAPRSAAAAAVSAARRCLAVTPDDPGALAIIGWTEVVINDRTEGLELLADAASRAPGNARVRTLHGWALSHSGEHDLAERELAPADGLPGTEAPELSTAWAVHAVMHGRLGPARERVQAVLAARPYEHRSLLVGAIIEMRLEDHEAAVDLARRLIRVRSRNSSQCQALLAYLLHRAGQVDEAGTLLQSALEDRLQYRPSTFIVPAAWAIRGEQDAAAALELAEAAGCPHRRWLLQALDMPRPELPYRAPA